MRFVARMGKLYNMQAYLTATQACNVLELVMNGVEVGSKKELR